MLERTEFFSSKTKYKPKNQVALVNNTVLMSSQSFNLSNSYGLFFSRKKRSYLPDNLSDPEK